MIDEELTAQEQEEGQRSSLPEEETLEAESQTATASLLSEEKTEETKDATELPKEEEPQPTEAENPADEQPEEQPEGKAEEDFDEQPEEEPTDKPEEAPKQPRSPRMIKGGSDSLKMGSVIAAFVFFAITTVIFSLYAYFSATFLFAPLLQTAESLSEAFAEIFGYLFGFIFTAIFVILQIPANIATIILFNRIRGGSETTWVNVLFLVFFILSVLMLAIVVLSFVAFLGMCLLA